MEGVEFVRELRREVPDIAILAVSGVVQRNSYLRIAKHFGADGVLPKPFTLDDLVGTAADLLKGSCASAASQ